MRGDGVRVLIVAAGKAGLASVRTLRRRCMSESKAYGRHARPARGAGTDAWAWTQQLG
jgi:hypothetical protein